MSTEALARSAAALPIEGRFIPLDQDRPAVTPAPYGYGTPSMELIESGFPAPLELRAAPYIGALQAAFDTWTNERPHVDPHLRRGLRLTCFNDLHARLRHDDLTNADVETSIAELHAETAGFLSLIGFVPPDDYQHPKKIRAY